MLAYTQSRLENAELQLKLGGERERARVDRQLGQAKERLSRVHVQQERARARRMTAEEQQEFWMAEALVAQEEISRLEREAQDLVVVAPGSLEPVRTGSADAVDDSDFEARLEHITAEGLHDEALIEEDLQPAPTDPDDAAPQELLVAENPVQPLSNTEQAVSQITEYSTGHDEAAFVVPDPPDSVQLVSKMVLDKPLTSTDAERTAADSPTRAPRSPAPRSVPADAAVDAARAAPATRNLWWGTRAALRLGLVEFKTATPTTAAREATSRSSQPKGTGTNDVTRTRVGTLSRPPLWLVGTAESRAEVLLALRLSGGLAVVALAFWTYLIGQDVAARRDSGAGWADPVVAIAFCLAPMYGGLRLMKVPAKPAAIVAAVIYLTWSVLLLFDLFPWTAPHFGTK
ncbi:hypothetical protein ADK96_37350 [Streptomyces sp. IGB124]|nr:hypothetical protein ADK96_37350 [Streptomyces sp. IGB124]